MKPIVAVSVILVFSTSPVLAAEPPAHAAAHKVFDQWDANKDGVLDAGELAKWLRGRSAQPIVHPEGAKPARETHPDHVFLSRYDANKDGSVSRAEFERWERDVAAEQKQLNDRLRRAMRHRHHRR